MLEPVLESGTGTDADIGFLYRVTRNAADITVTVDLPLAVTAVDDLTLGADMTRDTSDILTGRSVYVACAVDAVLHRGVRYDADQTARAVGAIDFAAFKGAFLHQASPGQETDQTAHIAVVFIYLIFVRTALDAAAVGTAADHGIVGCRRGDTAHGLSSPKAAHADIAVFYRTAVQKCRYTSDV